MHILIIPSWYKTPDHPMDGIFFEEQARQLFYSGVKVGVLFPEIQMRFSSRWTSKRPKPDNFNDAGIPTYYYFTRSIVPLSRWINYWFLAYGAEKIFKKYCRIHGKPDLIHAHSVFSGGIVAEYLSRKHSIPFVLTEHYSGLITSDISNISYNVSTIRRVFRRSEINIAVSHFFRDELCLRYDLNTKRIQVIPNNVNDLFFNWIPLKFSIPFRFLIVASLVSIKNHELLLASFSRVLQLHPCKLLIVGDGILKSRLENMVRDLGIHNDVTFYGYQKREQIKKLLDSSHVLVSSSRFETFGVNIVESIAAGRPVVATDSGGPRDIVTPINGILVKEHTPESFYLAMSNMILNYSGYNSQLMSDKCRRDFSGEALVNRLTTIYKSLL
jgi:glycosyltransferase involved in cell wall biosynthesis